MAATYSLSTWDPGETPEDDFGWTERFAGLSKWDLREAIRWAVQMGYSSVSYLVEREGRKDAS
jgi:hypothetical protein